MILLSWLACARTPICDQLVACTDSIGGELGQESAAVWGEDGSCWVNQERQACEAQCTAELNDAWARHGFDHPACDPTLAGLPAELTFVGFMNAYTDRFCQVWDDCNTASDCPAVTSSTVTATQCTSFDQASAEQCLQGEWTCDASFPGFEFPVPPEICNQVCPGR